MKIGRQFTKKLSDAMPAPWVCGLINMRNAVSGKTYRVHPHDEPDMPLYRVQDESEHLFICWLDRRYRSKRGVRVGIDALAQEYHLQHLSDLRDGLFIDCGANVGELGLWARAQGHRYIAFEPEAREARCCDLNNFDGAFETRRQALWHEETTLTFYRDPEHADSSVIKAKTPVDVTEISATTLDASVDMSGCKGPVILKVEAEGAEPEVLEGARKSLDRIDYVAIDCGYERGASRAHTFIETHDILMAKGFKLLQAGFKRVTALYGRAQ